MPSAVVSEHIGSRIKALSYDHDPGGTSAVLASPDGGTTIRYWDMRDLEHFAVLAKPTIVGGGGLTKLEIVASAAVSFASSTVIKDSGTVAADSLNDNVFLECNAPEIAHLAAAAGLDLRYVAARLTMATGTDEASVTYMGLPKRESSGLTTTIIT